jgi:DNA-binding SARP family transcriptional activator
LRLDGDADGALRILDAIDRHRGVWINEQADTWYGLALLLKGDVEGALARLRDAVESMQAGGRLLELPTAAVFLSEGEWRAGNELAADRAADVALEAARVQGSNHLLLQALADFPAVASRRLDAVVGTDSEWHRLGRALVAQGALAGVGADTVVELREFGRAAVLVDGEEQHIGLVRSLELLAFLAARRGAPAERTELLDALFEGRTDDSARAYLRQAIQVARKLLGDPDSLVTEDRCLRLGEGVSIEAESGVFEARLAEAARLHGADRLSLTLEALSIHERGTYLPDARSSWADERRSRLTELATDARAEAAELALSEGRVQDAQHLVDEVLRVDPYRESAWRLAMRIAAAFGNEDAVIAWFHRCEAALAQIGATPADATRRLLDQLRR